MSFVVCREPFSTTTTPTPLFPRRQLTLSCANAPLQFLDTVWQLVVQYPRVFEFTPRMLLLLADHVYSCRFGTFLFNCEREQRAVSLESATLSLWGHLRSTSASFLNPIYDPTVRSNACSGVGIVGFTPPPPPPPPVWVSVQGPDPKAPPPPVVCRVCHLPVGWAPSLPSAPV